jgi:hypothetical protein
MAAISLVECPACDMASQNGTGDSGLFQINAVHGYSVSWLADPANNAKAAFAVWSGAGGGTRGFQQWCVYPGGCGSDTPTKDANFSAALAMVQGASPADSGGNASVQPSGGSGGSSTLPFPILALAAMVVGAGIYMVDRIDPRAAWLLAFLILLTIAFKYPSFGGELSKVFTSVNNQQSGTNPGNAGVTSNVDTSSIPNIGFASHH